MHAMQIVTPGSAEDFPLVSTNLSLPRPDAGQMLLRVLACGVCHTDLHIVEGELTAPRLPLTPGHQVVAEIESVGEAVTGFEVGQRVGVPWMHTTCGKCEFCQRGAENLCERACFTGLHVDGGFAEYMLAAPQFVLSLPASLMTCRPRRCCVPVSSVTAPYGWLTCNRGSAWDYLVLAPAPTWPSNWHNFGAARCTCLPAHRSTAGMPSAWERSGQAVRMISRPSCSTGRSVLHPAGR